MFALLLATALAGPPQQVDDYVQLALSHHPALEAADARADGLDERVHLARALPDPRLSAGFFVQSVETRVGPQQVRLGVQQPLPFPTKLVQSGKAAASEAEAGRLSRDARALEVERDVREAFWTLWEVRELHTLQTEHLVLLEGLAHTVRGHLEVGRASLADVQQVELARFRLGDDLDALVAEERVAEARLIAALGTSPEQLVVSASPEPVRTGAIEGPLHPALQALDRQLQAKEHAARAAGADRLPDLTVGLDWIVTGPASMDGVDDSGKDALVAGVGLSVPLWQGNHGVALARSAEQTVQAERRARLEALQAELAITRTRLDDSARRVETVERTLLPQAEAAYEAVLGELTVGRGSIAEALLAQRALLDLGSRSVRALAENQRQQAHLAALRGVEG